MLSTSRVSSAKKQPLLWSDASSLKNLGFISSDSSSSSTIESCRRLGELNLTHTHTHTALVMLWLALWSVKQVIIKKKKNTHITSFLISFLSNQNHTDYESQAFVHSFVLLLRSLLHFIQWYKKTIAIIDTILTFCSILRVKTVPNRVRAQLVSQINTVVNDSELNESGEPIICLRKKTAYFPTI